MKKEELVKMGLTEEQAQSVVDAYTEEIKTFIPKSRLDEVITERNALKTTLEERDTQLNTLKKSTVDNEELQNQIKQLQADNKATKEKLESDLKDAKLTSSIKIALAGKVHDEDLVANLIDKSKIVMGDDGKIAGLSEQITTMQTEKSFLFKQGQQQQYTPANGNSSVPNPFAKDTFNLTDQGKLFKENPEQAKVLMAAAGVII